MFKIKIMLSQNRIKFIRSLDLKKNRHQQRCFVVEGEKMVLELLHSNFTTLEIFALPEFLIKYTALLDPQTKLWEVNESELKKISTLKTPNQALALVEMPKTTLHSEAFGSLSIALDNIQDPGNLGTIIRTANWFGVSHIFCSPDTVDAYNPKVIQATMGAIFRTHVIYDELETLIKKAKAQGTQVFGTLLEGVNMYEIALPQQAMIVMGNESKGISNNIQELIDSKIRIPDFPLGSNHMESLNVGIAHAIILAEFRRQFKA